MSGADKVTKNNLKLLPEYKIRQYGIREGDSIFIITEEEKRKLKLTPSEESLIHRTYKNSDICPYYVDVTDYTPLYVVYATKQIDIDSYPNIKSHLQKFKEILENKRECKEGKLPWYSLHWARDGKILSSLKIVTPRWGEDIKPFALQTAEFYENSDINLIILKDDVKENIYYVLGLLNSSLILTWMKMKARQKGLTRQSIPFQIPIHRIDFNNPEEVKMHDEIVEKVKHIRENMAKLAEYSKFFKNVRLTRIEPNAPLPDINDEEIIKSLPSEKIYSIRIHPGIKIRKPENFKEEEFHLSKVGKIDSTLAGDFQLQLKGKDGTIMFIEGAYELLKLISPILIDQKGRSWKEIKEILIPEDIMVFNKQKGEILNEIKDIRTTLLQLQNEINQMVYKLYNLDESEIKMVREHNR